MNNETKRTPHPWHQADHEIRVLACLKACEGVSTVQLESDHKQGYEPWGHVTHLEGENARLQSLLSTLASQSDLEIISEQQAEIANLKLTLTRADDRNAEHAAALIHHVTENGLLSDALNNLITAFMDSRSRAMLQTRIREALRVTENCKARAALNQVKP